MEHQPLLPDHATTVLLTFAAALFSMRVGRLIDAPGSTMLSVFDGGCCIYLACRRRAFALVIAAVSIGIDTGAPARLLCCKELLQPGQVVLRGLDVEDWISPAARAISRQYTVYMIHTLKCCSLYALRHRSPLFLYLVRIWEELQRALDEREVSPP